jgi:acid phosphatase family membrane protein YuiD
LAAGAGDQNPAGLSLHTSLELGFVAKCGGHAQLAFGAADIRNRCDWSALGVAITMVVTYDAAGVRRQAGIHAQRINMLFEELLRGHMVDQKELREVLGHTPLEVTGGVLFGILVAAVMWLIWPPVSF